MIAQHPHCVASVNLPAHDLDLHIFSNRMMIATKCDTSPARRKIFMVFMLQQNKVNATPHGPYTSSGDSHSLTHKTQMRLCWRGQRGDKLRGHGRTALCARDAKHRLRGFRSQIRVCAVDRRENCFRGGDVADSSALRRQGFNTELNISVSGLGLSK